MKITRLTVLAVMLAAGLIWATTHTGDYASIRPAGSETQAGNVIYFIMDSSDTQPVDTFYSDTVIIDTSTQWVNYGFEVIAATRADSVADTALVEIYTWTAYNLVSAKRLVSLDSFWSPTAADTIWKNFYVDTLILTRLWFETVITDSFILGEGVDTSKYTLRYQVLQKD